MEIRKEINGFYGLADMVWSGAVDTMKDIQNASKENELMNLLDDIFLDEIPTDTQVNDFLWFERGYIYENIGLTEDGELPEDEMAEKLNNSIESLKTEDDFDDFCCECDECPFDMICQTYEECEQMFDAVKRGDVTIDDVRNKMEA